MIYLTLPSSAWLKIHLYVTALLAQGLKVSLLGHLFICPHMIQQHIPVNKVVVVGEYFARAIFCTNSSLYYTQSLLHTTKTNCYTQKQIGGFGESNPRLQRCMRICVKAQTLNHTTRPNPRIHKNERQKSICIIYYQPCLIYTLHTTHTKSMKCDWSFSIFLVPSFTLLKTKKIVRQILKFISI